MNRIESFSGEHRWLSNFHPVEVLLDKEPYPSVEHAYQAAKIEIVDDSSAHLRRSLRCAATPGIAKRMGQTLVLRPGWEQLKLDVMLDLLRQKFKRPDLRHLLLDTGTVELVEGNSWGDCFWGVCKGVGENHLGRLLMQVRSEMKEG